MADHPTPPLAGSSVLLETRFDAATVTALRHRVAACAADAGLRGERLDDFVLAVYELLTNAVRHGGGHGGLRLWRDGTSLACEVADRGTGFDVAARAERLPVPAAPGGWGLFLAGRLTDRIDVASGPDGTTVRVSSGLT
ncbi:ATP-binding protein [Catenuloplanes atrovinosus]|uniref:Anti-sigma regulatory factor (Ser/Thr protein kinase) n=1 Tax=Catenuloplanes atrovinosus TaxID=137266 RepID=A0AAE4CDX5_9ACTN|nr:ATP-binding protein [Catenuloplanes atrovinosus]MDR7280932.1 anti-sigma regulatory factor (Ser/Thr protein kinase) [Catenuloplanes atrovinosus]